MVGEEEKVIISDDLALRDKTIEHVQNKMVSTYSIKYCSSVVSVPANHPYSDELSSLNHSLVHYWQAYIQDGLAVEEDSKRRMLLR